MTRKIVSVELTQDDKVVLNRIVNAHDMIQYKALGRILRWFIAQDDDAQKDILGRAPSFVATESPEDGSDQQVADDLLDGSVRDSEGDSTKQKPGRQKRNSNSGS